MRDSFTTEWPPQRSPYQLAVGQATIQILIQIAPLQQLDGNPRPTARKRLIRFPFTENCDDCLDGNTSVQIEFAMRKLHRAFVRLIAALVLAVGAATTVQAGPPTYLMLRRPESPGKHLQPGHPDAAMLDARTSGYAYGFFGTPPRSHASRHFGINRNYTQWSLW